MEFRNILAFGGSIQRYRVCTDPDLHGTIILSTP